MSMNGVSGGTPRQVEESEHHVHIIFRQILFEGADEES
jgi:hypothetical protein